MNQGLSFKRIGMVATLSIAMSFTLAASSEAVEAVSRDFQIRPLMRIPAGTVVSQTKTAGWSDLLLFVNGSLGRGDVSEVSGTVSHYASLFNLVYMANVKRDDQGNHVLDKIGVGFSTKIDGRDVIIDGDTHKRLGANLGMLGGAVFSANEKALDDVVQVARYRDGVIFDAPTIMLHEGGHKKMIVRFFVWVSPQGKVGTVCWKMDGYGSSNYHLLDDKVVLLHPHLVENRSMHVDGDRFTFGIPSEDAFAVVSLPPGRAYRVNGELLSLLAIPRYNADTFFNTIRKLSMTLASS